MAPIDWDRELKHRHGAATRLDGLDLYYDFEWESQFQDQRAQFTNGQALAKFVRHSSPPGKTPALLLTDRSEVDEGARETETDYVFVVNLPRYRRASADAALSYLASGLGTGIAQVAQLNELVATAEPGVIKAVIASQLTLEHINVWASERPERIAKLRELTRGETPTRPASVAELLSTVDPLAELDGDDLSAIAALFAPNTSRDRRLELLRRITEDPTGRYITGEVLAERTGERVRDARGAMSAYRRLLDSPAATETDMQQFIERNLWLLGLDYADMRPRQPLLQGTMDFILERFDGFHDLLELKSPQDEIVRVRTGHRRREAAPPPSAFALTGELAQALAQVHVYRDRLTRYEAATEDILGLPLSRDPLLTIVIGRADRLADHARRVLSEINKSLHRVQIVPYDILADRAQGVLDNVEGYLLTATDGLQVRGHGRSTDSPRGTH